MRLLAWVLLVATGIVGPAAALPGAAYFETVTDDVVLPDGIVTALTQDSQGQLWVGTQSGLLRYDGYRFRTWRHDPEQAHSLGGNYVRDLQPSDDGRLWVALQDAGLSLLDPISGNIQHFRHDPANRHSLASDAVLVVRRDTEAGLWIGTVEGLDHYDPRTGQFSHYRHDPDDPASLPSNLVRSLLVEADGTVWIGTTRGLARRNPDSGRIERLHADPDDPEGLAARYVYALARSRSGDLWIGTNGHGAARRTADGRLHWLPLDVAQPDHLSHRWISAIAQPDPDRLWLSTFGGGITEVSAASGKVRRRLRRDIAVPGSLAHDQIAPLLIDRSGVAWVGTWGGGLQRASAVGDAFRVLRHSPARTMALSHPDVRAVLELDDGHIWVGTAGNGIDVLDRQRGLVGGHRANATPAGSLGDGFVTALTQSADGTPWVGTQQGGLYRYDRQGHQFVQLGRSAGLVSEQIKSLTAGTSGQIWVGSNAGIDRIAADGSIRSIWVAPGGLILRAVQEDPAGDLWVGSATGLLVLPGGKAPALRLQAQVGSRRLDDLPIWTLARDPQGRLWLDSSRGPFLIKHRKNDIVWLQPLSDDQPAHSFGGNLLWDGDGRLWTPSFVEGAGDQPRYPLQRADGVDIGRPSPSASIRLRDGHLLFGGSEGLLLVDPHRFVRWSFAAPLVATELRIDGRVQPLARLAGGLRVTPTERSFSIEFAALDLSAPHRNAYRYRLLPFDRDWIAADASRRVASYGNLWPGHYRLEIAGSNRIGEWSPQSLTVDVWVLPAFWQSAWFVVLLGLGLGAFGYAGLRWRTRQIRRRADQLQSLVERRTAELHHSNTVLQASTRSLEAAHQRVLQTQQQLIQQEKMAALGTLTAGVAHEINNPVNFADGAVQNLDVELGRLHDFLRDLAGPEAPPDVLDAIATRFEQLGGMLAIAHDGHGRIKAIVRDLRQFTRLDEAERKPVPIAEPIQSTVNLIRTRFDRIAFDLDLGFNPQIECQPAKLGQVFMNLLVNACEAIAARGNAAQPPGRVHIRSAPGTLPDGRAAVAITVEDNGCGMSPAVAARIFEPFYTTKGAGAGTGLGLAITFGIVEDHGGGISVGSVPGEGSRFQLTLPLNTTLD